jgi:hypothetical protein
LFAPRREKEKKGISMSRSSSPCGQILLKLPGQALGRHLEFFVLGPFDIDDRPTRRTDDAGAPRGERDAVCSEVETHGSKVGTEEIFKTRAGLHEVEEVSEGLWLAKVKLTLIRPDVIVYFERDEVIQHHGLAASVERRTCIAGWALGEWEGIGCVGAPDEG